MHLRITKYNPANRNSKGHYLVDEWLDYSCIGDTYNGHIFTYEEYESVEGKYLSVIKTAFEHSGARELNVDCLERYEADPPCSDEVEQLLQRGYLFTSEEVVAVSQAILRLFFWAELNSYHKNFSITFRYDYYMFITTDDEHLIEIIKDNLPDGMYIG